MFQYDLHINETAKIDMKKIHRYIVKNFHSHTVADRIIVKINSKILLLKQYPYMYQTLYNYRNKNRKYRRLVVENFSIIYYIIEKEMKVIIIHIYYNRRNFLKS